MTVAAKAVIAGRTTPSSNGTEKNRAKPVQNDSIDTPEDLYSGFDNLIRKIIIGMMERWVVFPCTQSE